MSIRPSVRSHFQVNEPGLWASQLGLSASQSGQIYWRKNGQTDSRARAREPRIIWCLLVTIFFLIFLIFHYHFCVSIFCPFVLRMSEKESRETEKLSVHQFQFPFWVLSVSILFVRWFILSVLVVRVFGGQISGHRHVFIAALPIAHIWVEIKTITIKGIEVTQNGQK